MEAYRTVVFLGAKGCGKTTLINRHLNGDSSGDYRATSEADAYVDAGRQLVLVDTPGIPVSVLTSVRGQFETFLNDPLVSEYAGLERRDGADGAESKEGKGGAGGSSAASATEEALSAKKGDLHAHVDLLQTASAFVIVQSSDYRTQQMAWALREAIRSRHRGRGDAAWASRPVIIIVNNAGEVVISPPVDPNANPAKNNRDHVAWDLFHADFYEHTPGLDDNPKVRLPLATRPKGLNRKMKKAFKQMEAAKRLKEGHRLIEPVWVDAKTGRGIVGLFQHLESALEHAARSGGARSLQHHHKRMCNVRQCVVM